jgi:hypothetical protein
LLIYLFIIIIVICSTFPLVQPVIVPRYLNVFKPPNTRAQVDCTIEKSNPEASFTWQYQPCMAAGQVDCLLPHENWFPLPPSHPVIPSPGLVTNYSRVTIPKDQEAAFYRCTANNTYGSDSLTFKFSRTGMCSA